MATKKKATKKTKKKAVTYDQHRLKFMNIQSLHFREIFYKNGSKLTQWKYDKTEKRWELNTGAYNERVELVTQNGKKFVYTGLYRPSTVKIDGNVCHLHLTIDSTRTLPTL